MTRSPAFQDFRVRLQEVIVLWSLCVSEEVSPEERPSARRKNDSLCRAALVLLCAHMEGFFEQLVSDVLLFHELNNTQISAMPLSLLVVQVWRYLQISESAHDEKKWKALQDIRATTLVDESDRCARGMLDPELHTKGFATPRSAAVEALFDSVGMKEIWELIDKRLTTKRSRNELDALVARRHPIAHGDQAAKAAPDDVRRYIHAMWRLTRAFNDIVGRCLEEKFDVADPWSLLV